MITASGTADHRLTTINYQPPTSVLNQEIVTDTRKRAEQPTHLIPNNENAKNVRMDHSCGPAPAATSIGPRARSPPPPGRVGAKHYDPCPGPLDVGSEPAVYTAIKHNTT